MFGPVLLNKDDWVRRLGPFRFQFWACMLIGPLTYRMRSVGVCWSDGVWARAHGTHSVDQEKVYCLGIGEARKM